MHKISKVCLPTPNFTDSESADEYPDTGKFSNHKSRMSILTCQFGFLSIQTPLHMQMTNNITVQKQTNKELQTVNLKLF